MNAMRILGAVATTVLASSLGYGTVACGNPTESPEVQTAKAVSAASVSIHIYDQNGTRVGEGSGVLLAPRLVLTSGHLITGNYKWVVTTADGKQVTGSRGMTYDWMRYNSNKAHPRKHDVGVIHLDQQIKLDSYPSLVGEKIATGSKATRIRGTGAGFASIDTALTSHKGSPNAWLTEMNGGETLDTGGAVFNERGIVGVVSSRGMTTGNLYVAKVSGLMQWLAPKVACAGGAVGVRTFAQGAAKEICEEEAKKQAGAAGGNTGGSPNSGAPGGPGADNTGNTPGANGPGADNTGLTCDTNFEGVCSGGACAAYYPSNPGHEATGNPANAGKPGFDASGNPIGGAGGTNTPGSTGTTGTNNPQGPTGTNGTNNLGVTPNLGGAGGVGGFASSYYTNLAKPSSGNPNNPGNDATGQTPNTGGAGGGVFGPGNDATGTSGEEGFCQGPVDNPDVCPPEGDGCAGSNCGGGQPDDAVDYGNCACGAAGSDSSAVYLR